MYRRVADFWIEEALCSVAVQVVAVLQVNHARGVVLQDGMFYTELRQDIGNLAKQDAGRARLSRKARV